MKIHRYYLFIILAFLVVFSFGQKSAINNRFDSAAMYPRLQIDRHMVYIPLQEYMFSHHPYLTFFKGSFIAMWSNGMKDEDDPGQRVVISRSDDFIHWSSPIALADAEMGQYGRQTILTAAGFYEHDNQLIAYYGSYDSERTNTRLLIKTTADGIQWSSAVDLHLPVIPNLPPKAIKNGRLIICGNFSFPYSDDASGLTAWHMSGFYPPELGNISDNPWSFWKVSKGLELPVSLCEGSFFQTDDSVLHMLLRSAGATFAGYLWLTESKDNGNTWSRPVETGFTDNDHKFHFGRLPDGRFYYVGTPVSFPRGRRSPLVLSLSSDGVNFTDHHIIADQPFKHKSEGRYKEGEYGYPSTFVKDGSVYIIVSRQKEGVEVIRFKLSQL